MSRLARGGKRQGRVGAQYTNRSDLATGPRAPSVPQVAPAGNQPHGAQAAQLRSMQALPLATQPPVPSSATGVAVTGAAPPPLTPLDAPTQRPGEPVTHGADSGPGADSSILGIQPDNPLVSAAAALNQLGDIADPDTARYRSLLNAMVGNSGAI